MPSVTNVLALPEYHDQQEQKEPCSLDKTKCHKKHFYTRKGITSTVTVWDDDDDDNDDGINVDIIGSGNQKTPYNILVPFKVRYV